MFDFPIDNNLYQTRDSVKVESSDYFVTLSELYRRWNVRHFYLISIDEFISGHEEQLAELAKNDTYQFDMIYYAAILKFWPMISLEVFQTLILKGAEIQEIYPDLFPPGLAKRYEAEREILDYKYQLLANPPAKFLKYAPKAASLMGRKSLTSKSIMDVSIRGAVFNIDAHLVDHIHIDISSLLQHIHVSEEIPIIRALVNQVIATKLRPPDLLEGSPEDISRIFEKVKQRIQIVDTESFRDVILFVLPVLNYTESDTTLYLTLIIQNDGSYQVRGAWNDEVELDFPTMFQIVTITVNPVIEVINSLGRKVFDSIRQLDPIGQYNVRLSGLHLGLVWKMPVTNAADSLNLGNFCEKMLLQESLKSHPLNWRSKKMGITINLLRG